MDPLWPSLAAELKKELPAQQFDTWIKPLRGERHGEELVLLAPNHHVLRWVRSNLLNKIESRIERVAANLSGPSEVVAQIPAIGAPAPRLVSNPDGTTDTITFQNAARVPNGLAFDFLAPPQGGSRAPPVMTGHAGGLITLNLAEADDAERERGQRGRTPGAPQERHARLLRRRDGPP